MGKQSLFDSIREWIGGVAFRVFLWSNRMTQDQYIDAIVEEAWSEGDIQNPIPHEVYKKMKGDGVV